MSDLQNWLPSTTIVDMRKVVVLALATIMLCVGCFMQQAKADAPLKSTNYEFDESVVGGGGLTQESSANFQAGESIGDLDIGNSSSAGYQINGGYTTTSDPALSFSIV